MEEIPRWCVHDRVRLQNEPNAPGDDNITIAGLDGEDGCRLKGEDAENIAPFEVRQDFNSRIRLWQGHQFMLHVDCATSTCTGGVVTDPDVQDSKLQLRQGMVRLLEALRRRRNADIHVIQTKGLIPAPVMLHCSAPRYSERYHTAAENALSQCYRVFLETATEHGVQSIAVGNHSRHGKSYPTRLAAHVAIRTVRRFMERVRCPLQSIVICTASHEEYMEFSSVMRYYFPRDEEEAARGASMLSRVDIGDELGEAWLPERDIQIRKAVDYGVKPGTALSPECPNTASSTASTPGPATPDARDSMFSSYRRCMTPLTPLSQNTQEDDLSSAFMSLAPDPDAERSKVLVERHAIDRMSPRFNAETRAIWRKKALCADLSVVSGMRIFHYAGVDLCGRKVLLFVGAHVKSVTFEELYYQCIREIEGVGDQKYVIVYACAKTTSSPSSPGEGLPTPPSSTASSRMQGSNPLSLDFLYRLYSVLSAEKQRSLEAVIMVHASLGQRMAVQMRQLGIGTGLWRKTVFCKRLSDLWQYVDSRHVAIPDAVIDADRELA